MNQDKKLTDIEVANKKSERIMNGINLWAGFYRENPQRFVSDYLHIKLKTFQKILIYVMMHYHHVIFCASRGLGKTWLTALFCVVRCILYPGTKICIASGTRTQANEVLSKIIDDFCKNYDWGSENLKREISYSSIGPNKAVIEFRNGSWIKVVTASDSGRGARANVIIIDEFRMVDLGVINTVIKKFLSNERHPLYLDKDEYKHLKERNKEIYMSSCWYKQHWSFDKLKSFFANMFNETRKYFVCGLPYQIAIKEELLSREQVEDEMSEEDFDQTTFDMEMGCFWIGDSDDSFFKYEDIINRRNIKKSYPILPLVMSGKEKISALSFGERRILSVDVALMASKKKKKNDASAIIINSAMLSSNRTYIANIMLCDTYEGLTTDELGLIIMRYYYLYNCTDIVLDCNGVGAGVYDFIIKDQFDAETGEVYNALSCCNDSDMAERCKVKNAKKVIWSVKASESFNTEICIYLRSGFQKGKINLLIEEYEANEILKNKVSGFNKLPESKKNLYRLPYVQTRLTQSELTLLEYTVTGKNIKVKEKTGMRKDRYSSLAYNYWVMIQLERKLKPQNSNEESTLFVARKPRLRRI